MLSALVAAAAIDYAAMFEKTVSLTNDEGAVVATGTFTFFMLEG